MSDQTPAKHASRPSSFPVTHWSIVLRAASDQDAQARLAIEQLCRQYWKPLYIFVRHQGRAHHEAEDATQQFLAQLLASGGLAKARPNRGRFRTFLLAGLRNFLVSEWRRSLAAKRGGGLSLLGLDANALGAHALEPIDPGLTPEQAFDRSWAQNLINQAVRDLQNEYDRSDRSQVFDAIAPYIWGAEPDDDGSGRAGAAGLSVSAFRVALHRARRRLGDRLRAQVAETVASEDEIDIELSHLVKAFSAS